MLGKIALGILLFMIPSGWVVFSVKRKFPSWLNMLYWLTFSLYFAVTGVYFLTKLGVA